MNSLSIMAPRQEPPENPALLYRTSYDMHQKLVTSDADHLQAAMDSSHT